MAKYLFDFSETLKYFCGMLLCGQFLFPLNNSNFKFRVNNDGYKRFDLKVFENIIGLK